MSDITDFEGYATIHARNEEVKDLIALTNSPYKSVRDAIYHSGCIPAIKELNKERRFS